MRVVIQRVSETSLTIEYKIHSTIKQGLLVLVGFEDADSHEDIEWLSKKISELRIFPDGEGKMNLSVQEIQGEIMIVSQFTLFAATKKGNRPSFIKSAKPEIAFPLYEKFIQQMNEIMPGKVKTGVFGADMQISLINNGPVTILFDSKNRE